MKKFTYKNRAILSLGLVLVIGLSACRQNTSITSKSFSIRLDVQQAPIAGVPAVAKIFALDDQGNVNTSFVGTVHFSSSDPRADVPSDYTFVKSDQGVHIFTSLVLKTAGTQQIGASTPGALNTKVTSTSNVGVVPADPSLVVYTSLPASTLTAGAAFLSPLSGQILDAFGNVVSAGSISLSLLAYSDSNCTIALSSGLSTDAGAKTSPVVKSSGGSASFSQLSFTQAGDVYFGISSPNLKTACSPGVHVIPGAANQLSYSKIISPQAVAGVALGVQPQVSVLDAYGNLVGSSVAPISVSAFADAACQTQASAALIATASSVNATAGVSNFAGVMYNLATTFYIQASSSGLKSACSSGVSVLPASANRLAFSTQPSSAAVAGVVLGVQPVVKLFDSFGNLVISAANPISIAAFSDSNCTVSALSGFTGATVAGSMGVATFSGLNDTKAENVFLGASGTGLVGACSTAVNVAAASASKLVITSQPSASAVAGVFFGSQPKLLAQDAFGNTAVLFNGAVTLSAFTDNQCKAGASGLLQAGVNPVSAAAGMAAFTGVNYQKAETIYLLASASGVSSVCSTSVQVSAAGAAKLILTAQPSLSAAAGAVLASQPKVALQDAFGNLAISSNFPILLAAFSDSACKVAAAGTLSATSNPVTASAGAASFSGVKYSSAGNIFLGVSSGSLAGACSSMVSITAVVVLGSATLNWDANTETTLAGYKIYMGTASGVYGPAVDVGKTTTYVANGLSNGKTYFFIVTAYDSSGVESPHSGEVSKVIP